jgi:hypothetical protein
MGAEDLTKFLRAVTVRESPWEFVTSAGVEFSIGTPIAHVGLNGTTGAIWVKGRGNSATIRLTYAGAGGSVGLALIPFPGNFSFSIPQMPSSGKIYQLPFAGKTLSLNELKGAFVLLGVAGDFGPGWGQSAMFLGGDIRIAIAMSVVTSAAMQVPTLIATSNACVRFGGMVATALPANLGFSAYVGCLQ